LQNNPVFGLHSDVLHMHVTGFVMSPCIFVQSGIFLQRQG
jgi:hypothetical protein